MAQTIESMNRTAAKHGKAPTAGPSTTTTESAVEKRKREARKANATAVYEAHQSQTELGSPLVAPDGTLRVIPNLGRSVSVVGTAEDEATARAWLESGEGDCDLVIIDIFLRKGSGLGVLQGLAQSQRDCKRVVLSNFATPDMRRKCLDLGAHKVFDKSNEIDALIGYCLRLSEGGGDTEPGALQELS